MSNTNNIFYTNIGGGQAILKYLNTNIYIWKHKQDVYHSYHESPLPISIILNDSSLDNGQPAQRINSKHLSLYYI